MATTMISVNLPENSQDSSQSALELLKPDPPLEQKAEAKIQGNLLNDIDNCSSAFGHFYIQKPADLKYSGTEGPRLMRISLL